MNALVVRAALVAIAGLSLGACSTYGPDGYGYSRVAVGYGSGYYSDPYYGWYDGYYYPGSGYYVWDRNGYRHRWSSRHQRYWYARRGDRRVHDNWSGYQYRRKGDYHAAPAYRHRGRPDAARGHGYRDGRPDARDGTRYSGRRPEANQRRDTERHHVDAPRRYRDQRADRPSRSERHDARSERRGQREERRGKRQKRDD